MSDHIILGTNKGTILLDRLNGGWKSRPVAHSGAGVSYAARDPRSGTLWAALIHGQWGPKLSRSTDEGKTWGDAPQIKYPEGTRYIDGFETEDGTSASNEATAGGADKPKKPKFKPGKLIMIWNLEFGGEDQPGRMYAGTIPGGLFVSNDGGESFELNMPLWNHESRGGDVSKGNGNGASHWFGGGAQVWGEGGPGIHSVVVDPRDSKRWLIGISCAGVLETTDDGKSWQGRNKGLLATFLPKPDAEWGHDPHHIMASRDNPDHLWMQNHCGVFYSSDGAKNWQPVSKEGNDIHFGFPVAADAKDGKTAWVVPGIADDKRMAKGGLFVARTQDGGKNWEELREGLPQEHSYDVVYRHALDIDGDRLAFGSTTGNLYVSDNRGESWHSIGSNFPPINSVRFA
jgi:photosystem II stability/assembly factor-like uncharacterized protein